METTYIFELDYANRTKEIPFIRDVLDTFDKSISGASLFVNNNPYNFEFYLQLTFQNRNEEFDKWLSLNYKNKKRKYNYFIEDLMFSAMNRGYNAFTGIENYMLERLITKEAVDGGLFLFSDKEDFDRKFKGGMIMNKFKVFLSHSSKDKDIVNKLFEELQRAEINAWYDKYEIEPGDSITDKINEGLGKSDVGVLVLSKNFFDINSGWPKNEMNYFIQKRMKNQEINFICINLDLEHEELPPLIQDYRFINWKEEDAVQQLINVLKKKKESKS